LTRVALATGGRLVDVPVYSYVCNKCGAESDKFYFKHSDKEAWIDCPLCDGAALATATVAHVAGRHTQKDSIKVPGSRVSVGYTGKEHK
jgi:DNA-directed RNA polymerase subunit RPC12/RpoP